jgi:hypothetical protein
MPRLDPHPRPSSSRASSLGVRGALQSAAPSSRDRSRRAHRRRRTHSPVAPSRRSSRRAWRTHPRVLRGGRLVTLLQGTADLTLLSTCGWADRHIEVTATCRFNVQIRGKDRSPSGKPFRAPCVGSPCDNEAQSGMQAGIADAIDILVPFTSYRRSRVGSGSSIGSGSTFEVLGARWSRARCGRWSL